MKKLFSRSSSSSSKEKIIIDVASESQLKIQAVEQAAKRLKIDITTFPSPNTESGVNKQPIGYEEMRKGAENRLKMARNIIKKDVLQIKSNFIISIENGIVETEPNVWYDFAYILIEDFKTGQQRNAISMGIQFPADFVKKMKEIGPDKTTVGEQMANEIELCQKDDPHLFLSGIKLSRVDILADTVEKVLCQFL